MDHNTILGNRAEQDGDCKKTDCTRCSEELVFAMQDKHHDFSIGLRTILQCLRLAEQEGNVPPLPTDWWNKIACRHGTYFTTEYERE
ncbi:XRE family transcriptional regulator [Pseudodesulfovibrio senegalensis]|uniref:XRE family transcriptional regulator n=1 Tax=Pseudodesulfovibrio senegalensis TaxID=1721087 RepID=A0A6N6N0A5_9BACT|nr:XRE family transcriptional regulator [Pseudodesulfovibrio senegalensis]KAB1440345.1 XRE family transcriptional regulator [Pseudodesulfovibrio senegalensis]